VSSPFASPSGIGSSSSAPVPTTPLALDEIVEQVRELLLIQLGDKTRFEAVVLRPSSSRAESQEGMYLSQLAAGAIRALIEALSTGHDLDHLLSVLQPPPGSMQTDYLSYLLFSCPEESLLIQNTLQRYLQLLLRLLSIYHTNAQDKKLKNLLKARPPRSPR
jgi:hypothetical protein